MCCCWCGRGSRSSRTSTSRSSPRHMFTSSPSCACRSRCVGPRARPCARSPWPEPPGNRSGRVETRPPKTAWPRELAATDRLEAVQAVDRPGPGGHERHLRLFAAVGADHIVHDPRPAVALGRAARRPAFRTPAGLVLEPARLVELLLPGREDEITPTVTALQRPVRETHRLASPKSRSEAPDVVDRSTPSSVAGAILTRLPVIW